MLFNSPIYIFLFLPIVVLVYFVLNRQRLITLGKSWLVLASLFFYSFWNPLYLPILAGSIVVNFGFGALLSRPSDRVNIRRIVLSIGVILNLLLLGYFKYADFFMTNINMITSSQFDLLQLALPLAISFFTFQQIAYLVDCYYNRVYETDFFNYSLFVTFFPQLLLGPIVRYREMMPQFASLRTKSLNYQNFSYGLLLLFIGLFKIVVLADTFALWANQGFDRLTILNFADAWAASLSFSLQLYFDFSGYTDMALGCAYLFNIRLPLNFNSPYKALNLTEFWSRWHMTLSYWITDTLRIPLINREAEQPNDTTTGGSDQHNGKTLAIVFLIIVVYGLWHGASLTFLLWGLFMGLATIIHRYWQRRNPPLPHWPAWFITFGCINFSWVLFRAPSFEGALNIYRGMIGLNGFTTQASLPDNALQLCLLVLAFTVFAPNSMELKERFQPNLRWICFIITTITISIFHLTPIIDFFYLRF